ncbi:hypothetical protein MM300_17480 [Evansella sp. LMS18]|uniref:YpoC family protein n=1 Tax=Evansella sp. LMS18 TaxID=2924033 RepID=UPI0020D158D4|nr:hypothetical protein [Evansella sp. LMS18]UTR09666.1 hypothetical protein MM300_17480 [Evansella sp. LMS18]
MGKRLVSVPPEFHQEPFYKAGDTAELKGDVHSIKEVWQNGYFLHDIASFYNMNEPFPVPWSNPEEVTKLAYGLWKEEGRPQLENLFKARNKTEARPLIIMYTAIYIQVMHWVNRQPVRSLQGVTEAVSAFQYAPLNVSDRLQYIIASPNQFHAFITLNELYIESGKKWAVFLMKNK